MPRQAIFFIAVLLWINIGCGDKFSKPFLLQLFCWVIEVGSEFEDQDFADHFHFLPSGGRKLADRLIPEVRRIAHELYGK